MPFTDPLPDLPVTWPSAQSPLVNPDLTPAQPFVTLLRQLREWITKADGAIEEGGTQVKTVAQLPSAVGITGVSYMVSDSTSTTFWATVAGTGANTVRVTSNGTVWKIG